METSHKHIVHIGKSGMTYLLTQQYTSPNCIDVVKRNDKYGYYLR